MNPPAAAPSPQESPRPADAGWSPTLWLAVIMFALAAHVAFIMSFGEVKPAAPRVVDKVLALRLAAAADELMALNDPTLFARPQREDFMAVGGMNLPEIKPPSFGRTQPARWLPFSGERLGADFGRFLSTNFVVSREPLDFKPEPELSAPRPAIEPALGQNSTMETEGELAKRQLPCDLMLTNWPFPDVLAPCKVQVLVNEAGNVVSAVVLPPEDGLAAAGQYALADQRALEIARTLRFRPAAQPVVGRVIFNWHTVPPVTTTNGHE